MAENEMNRNGNGINTSTANDFEISMPVAPEGSMPAEPGNDMEQTPTPPATPEESLPAEPGTDGEQTPIPPVAPEERRPVPSIPSTSMPGYPISPSYPTIPSYPTVPSYPSPQYFGQVRFLNASTNSFPVNISVDNTAYAVNSRFGTVSTYDWISDGFHTITVRRSTGLRSILLQQTLPFTAGVKATMVLTDTPYGGLNMVKVIDTGCTSMPYNTGCYRFANMAYSGSNFDLLLYGGETVFRNVGFQEVTSYKQAMAGSYQFYVTNSGNFSIIREMPVIVIGAITNTGARNEPLVSFQVDITARRNYSTYMIGNTWSDNILRALTIED